MIFVYAIKGVGSGYDGFDADGGCLAAHVEGGIPGGRAVVHVWKDVAM